MNFINEINDILWTYILIIMLLGCAVWFSIRTRFVQFRMLREMIVLLSESAGTVSYTHLTLPTKRIV